MDFINNNLTNDDNKTSSINLENDNAAHNAANEVESIFEISQEANRIIGKAYPKAALEEEEEPLPLALAAQASVAHSAILEQLLTHVERVNLDAVIGLPEGKEMKEKHYQFAVVKQLIDIAKRRKWNMRNLNDYIYVFNGAYWKQHNKDDIKNFLSDAAVKMGIPEYDAKYYKFVDSLFKQFLSDAHLSSQEPDESKILINLQNGTFEFKDGRWQHKDFEPNDFLTYQLPFAYTPDAKCPMFDNYLAKVLPDECSRLVLQEFAGYIFTKLPLEKCLVLTGGGSNGKSVFFNIIYALVGRENALTFSMSYFNHETNRAKLSNVLVNYSSETGFKLHPEIFKALVSGEPVQARELYCRPFTLHNKVKFIMNCNLLPNETENTDAYFRRFIIIPFQVTITEAEKDIELADKIIGAELPGVFNWLLEGLERIVENKKFTPCDKADLALSEFKKQADTVQLFVDEFNYQPSKARKVSLKDLYTGYEDFCKGDKLKSMGRTKFSKELETKGFEKMPRTNAGYFFGIEARPEE
jgi:putative DNA primase/helicase